MKVLLLGGKGFLGRHIAEALALRPAGKRAALHVTVPAWIARVASHLCDLALARRFRSATWS